MGSVLSCKSRRVQTRQQPRESESIFIPVSPTANLPPLCGRRSVPVEFPLVNIRQTRHGLGVFAAFDIPEGTVITAYGGIVKYESPEEYKKRSFDFEYWRETVYHIAFAHENVHYILDGKDAPRDNPRICGHLMNDPVDWRDFEWEFHRIISRSLEDKYKIGLVVDTSTFPSDFYKDPLVAHWFLSMMRYASGKQAQQQMKENTRILEIVPYLRSVRADVTTFRDVKKGEELLFGYSLGYWGYRFFSHLSKELGTCIPILLWDHFKTSLSNTGWSIIKVHLTTELSPDETEKFLTRDCLQVMCGVNPDNADDVRPFSCITAKFLRVLEFAEFIQSRIDPMLPVLSLKSTGTIQKRIEPLQEHYFGSVIYNAGA